MSSLTDIDKRYLEKILNMGSGYVLDYTDATFDGFFARHGVSIHGQKYQTYGTSKDKKLRSFWEQEPDTLVGQALSEMLDSYEAACDLDGEEVDGTVLEKARGVVARLLGKPQKTKPKNTVKDFLYQEFTIPNIQKLPVEEVPWCTTRDLGPQLSCTRGYEVPHEHFQTHSAEVCEEGLSREELA